MEETKILNTEKITLEVAILELKYPDLSQEDIDEYLDIISAIKSGQEVYNITTNKGDYLLYIKNDNIDDIEDIR